MGGESTYGLDADVVLCILRVGDKGLDEEVSQVAVDCLDALQLVGALCYPLLGFGPGLVEGEQAALAAAFDELVGFGDEAGAAVQQPGIGGLGLVEDAANVGVVIEVQGGEAGGRVVGCLGGQGRGLDDGGAGEVVIEDGLAVGLENGLCGHCGDAVRCCVDRTGAGEVGSCGAASRRI